MIKIDMWYGDEPQKRIKSTLLLMILIHGTEATYTSKGA